MRWPDYELTLLVNAYDDGLSTGAIRRYIPGFLGPSDFRKNIVSTLLPFSPEYLVLARLLEFRLPIRNHRYDDFASLLRVNEQIQSDLELLSHATKTTFSRWATEFFSYQDKQEAPFDFNDCSVGNIVYAGAYLALGSNFQSACNAMCKFLGTEVKIVNISNEEAHLSGILSNGEILIDESSIVSKPLSSKIEKIVLTKNGLTMNQVKNLESITVENRFKAFEKLQDKINISAQAKSTMESTDVLIYGSGTQHSSLFPSYMVMNQNSILPSANALKVFMANLDYDNDTRNLSLMEIMSSASRYWNLPVSHMVDYLFLDSESIYSSEFNDFEKIVEVRNQNFHNNENPRIHSGYKVFQEVRRLISQKTTSKAFKSQRLSISVVIPEEMGDKRAMVARETSEIPWPIETNYEIKVDCHSEAAMIAALAKWYKDDESEFFAGICGFGTYALGDLLIAIEKFNQDPCSLGIGNRFQSREQWLSIMNSTFGESNFRSFLATVGAAFLNILVRFKFKISISDPFSKIFLVSRSALEKANFTEFDFHTASLSSVYCKLWSSDIDFFEFPCRYRPDYGSNKILPALARGLRDASEVIRHR
jgi:2-phospho-L-lactate transferase/gluconeogenesis factor (CofD/UPF0052 family)